MPQNILSPAVQLFIRRFFALSFFVIGFFWLAVYFVNDSEKTFLQALNIWACLYLIIGAVLFFRRAPLVVLNILLTVVVLNYGYMFLETAAYIKDGLDPDKRSLTLYNRPCAQYDEARGYKWTGTTCRTARMEKGTLIYDQKFPINNEGYISERQYTSRKKNDRVRRFMVLGDSFTAGEYLEKNWPDRVNELLALASKGEQYEVYSFGVDGGGLDDWYEIFFNEIITGYEFDNLIIAVYNENVYRQRSVLHLTNRNAYFGRIPPTDMNFKQDMFSKVERVGRVVNDTGFDKILKQYGHDTFVFLPVKTHVLDRLKRRFQESFPTKSADSGRRRPDHEDKMRQFDRLSQIVKWCQDRNIKVLITFIPANGHVFKMHSEPKNTPSRLSELREFSAFFGADFFDGREAFSDVVSVQALFKYWFIYDGHWNQNGSDRFAGRMKNIILKQYPAP